MGKRYFSHSKNEVMIAHFPGSCKLIKRELLNSLTDTVFYIPDNIDIISVITDDCLENAPLHKQLLHNKIRYINPVKGKKINWVMTMKIPLILDGLIESKKEYSLVLDGLDVVIISDLNGIIEKFLTYNKKVLFNATIWKLPGMLTETLKNRQQYGKYKFLNAGCCFGKTKDLIDFYKYVKEVFESSRETKKSEQYFIRKAFDKRQEEVFFDYECKIFQVWHSTKEIYEGDKVYLD
ncbi:MAG: hypothetical protein LBR74_10185 [Eubacterium sp.]|jgi:hypothetical protein|nr:hypothetical protein [Eubacterium sp.]